MIVDGASKKSIFLVCLMLSALVIWAPPVSADDIGAADQLQAQDISAIFDAESESTTVTWRNIEESGGEPNLFQELWTAKYHVFRSEQVIDNVSIIGLTPFATVNACDQSSSGGNPLNCRGVSGTHLGHSVTYQLPPGVNGTFFYGIVTEHSNGLNMTLLDANASSTFEPVEEITSPIRTPYYLQAEYLPSTSATELSWVNYNVINPILPEIGPDAYSIHVWHSDIPIVRSNGLTLIQSSSPIANLSAGVSSYSVPIPSSTSRESYYAVTYLLPNWTSSGDSYEDIRFLSGNTLTSSIVEDNIAPESVSSVDAIFVPDEYSGKGNTTISWIGPIGEVGETYRIWVAGVPFASTNRTDITLIAELGDDNSSFVYEVPRGHIGSSYYCVEVNDQFGIPALELGCSNEIFEDSFSPWIAEPTNVLAEYIGAGKTRVTWTDQLGVEGELYHVWWSNYRVVEGQFVENQSAHWLASVPDGFGEAIVDVPAGEYRDNSFYFVTSQARYGHLNGTYEYRGFVQNWDGPIVEDTMIPDDPRITSLEMLGFMNLVILKFVNDPGESEETYQLYRNFGTPFVNESVTSDVILDDGWEPILDTIITNETSPSVIVRQISIDENITRDVWYAVVATDSWGNLNSMIIAGLGGNALSIEEDTTPPEIIITIDDIESGPLQDGEHRVIVETNENLDVPPSINITVDNDKTYTETDVPMNLLSDNIANPDKGPSYYFDFDILSGDKFGNLTLHIMVRDAVSNEEWHNVTNWIIDATAPIINIYSPGSMTDTKYMYGEQITVHASATDDVGILWAKYKVISNQGAHNQASSSWMNLTDEHLSWIDGDIAILIIISSSDFTPGNHRVELKVSDIVGEERSKGVTFRVDSCHQTINGTTRCAYEEALEPEEAAIIIEPSFTDPPYVFVFGLAFFNILAFVIVFLVITISLSSPKKRGEGDEDGGDDWMSEFIGTSAEPDMDTILAGDKPKEEEKPSEAAMPDDDDPFAVNVLTKKSRRKKKVAVEEDDDDDPEEEPKSKSKRNKVARRATKRKK
jgi:hypothetical protein